MNKYWRNSILYSGMIIMIIYLGLHAYLGRYSRFMADDYCSAYLANSKGVLGATFHYYMKWTGRFSANFFDSLFGIMGPIVTPYIPAFVIIVWLIVLIGTLSLLIKSRHHKYYFDKILLASSILSATFMNSKNIFQSLYWGQGMRSVVPPLILATAFLGLIQYCHKRKIRKRFIWLLLTGGLTFIAGGFSETYVAVQTSILTIIAILGILLDKSYLRKNWFILVIVGLFGSLVAMGFVVFAPGNRFRQKFFPPPPDFFELIDITLACLAEYRAGIMASERKLLNLLGVIALFILFGGGETFVKRYDQTPIRLTLWKVIGIPFITLILLFACFAPAAYGMSRYPPARTEIIPTYILVCSVACWGYFLGQVILNYVPNFGGKGRSLWIMASWIIFVLFTLNTLYTIRLTIKLQPTLKEFATKWDNIDRSIKEAKSEDQDTIAVMPIHNYAGLDDIGGDPDHWVNKCVSDYYGLVVKTDNSLQK